MEKYVAGEQCGTFEASLKNESVISQCKELLTHDFSPSYILVFS